MRLSIATNAAAVHNHLAGVQDAVKKTKIWAGRYAQQKINTQAKRVFAKDLGVPQRYIISRFGGSGGKGFNPKPYVVFRYEHLNVGGTKKHVAVVTKYNVKGGKRGKGHGGLKALKGTYPRAFVYSGTSKSGKKFTSPTVYQREGKTAKPIHLVKIDLGDRYAMRFTKIARMIGPFEYENEFYRVFDYKVRGALRGSR